MLNKSSILPSDYCNIHKNKDPHSGKYGIFYKLEIKGQYKVLNHSEIKRSCRLL